MDINKLLNDTMDDIKKLLDVDTVIGHPIINGDTIIVPITKISLGFVTGAGDIEIKNSKNKDTPLGAIGAGGNITPIGFLISDGIDVKYVNIDGGEKWSNCLEGIIDFLSH